MIFFANLMWVGSCKNADYYAIPTFSNGALQAVIEIPAGEHLKTEYIEGRKFQADTLKGKPRTIEYLPYPGNYGFIPGTKMDTARGGDGDALDILVIGKRVETGSVLSVIPIGVLLLRDDGEQDTKILAVPLDAELSVIDVRSYVDLLVKYPSIKDILTLWFINYEGFDANDLIGWENEQYALREINKWSHSTDRSD